MIPIIKDHDYRSETIGHIDLINGQLIVEFPVEARVTKDMFWSAFKGAGVRFLEEWQIEHEFFVKRVKILEFSVTEGR